MYILYFICADECDKNIKKINIWSRFTLVILLDKNNIYKIEYINNRKDYIELEKKSQFYFTSSN